MKHYIMLLCFAPFLGLQAQNEVRLNLTNGSRTPDVLKHRKTVSFHLEGINPHVQQAKVNGRNIVLASIPQGPWKSFVDSAKDADKGTGGGAEAAVQKMSGEGFAPPVGDSSNVALKADMKPLRKAAAELDAAWKRVQENSTLHDSAQALAYDPCMSTATILKELQQLVGNDPVMGRTARLHRDLETANMNMQLANTTYLELAEAAGAKDQAERMAAPLVTVMDAVSTYLADDKVLEKAPEAEAALLRAMDPSTYRFDQVLGQANGDLYEIVYSITKRDQADESDCLQERNDTIELSVVGGWRLDWGGRFRPDLKRAGRGLQSERRPGHQR